MLFQVFGLFLLVNLVLGSGLWHANYGSPYLNSYPHSDSHSFDSNYGHSGGLSRDWSHSNEHNDDFAKGYNEGSQGDWSKLSYGGHKSKASGNTFSQSYEHDNGDDFGHDNSYNDGFDRGQNFYGRGDYHAPGYLPYH